VHYLESLYAVVATEGLKDKLETAFDKSDVRT